MKQLLVLLMLSLVSLYGSAQDEWQVPQNAKGVNNPLDPSNEKVILKGEKIFGSMCWVCHGEEAKGDGPNAEMLDPRPKNLTTEQVANQTDGEIYWKITHGRGEMVGYGEVLTDEQRWQLVSFIRSLALENQ